MLPDVRQRFRSWVPRWWAGNAGRAGAALDILLAPVEMAYRTAIAARNQRYEGGWLTAQRPPIPVVSVGNLTVGGAGKTPVAALLAGLLRARGCRPAIVLRGYGRDEILVHRELNPEIPVFAAARRIEAVRAAAARDCNVAVLDDGFQHRSIGRDLDLLLISANSWSSRRRLLPRGPWREDLSAAKRADLILITRKSGAAGSERVEAALRRAVPEVPTVECGLSPALLVGLHDASELAPEALGGRSVLAAAALAEPAPFEDNLRGLGAEVQLVSFPDHHEYTAADGALLSARAAGRPLVVTLKDAVKLRRVLPASTDALVLLQRVELGRGAEHLTDALDRIAERAGDR